LILDYRVASQATPFAGNWSFQLNAGLSGTLQVSTYKAHDDPGACDHGAQLVMDLVNPSGMASGQVFQWLQVFSETGDSGSRSGVVDPPSGQQIPILDPAGNIVGYRSADDLPFYGNATSASSLHFFDWPSDPLPDTSSHGGGVSFITYLTSWDGALDSPTEIVNVYGALEWGYTYQCPEPSTLSLAAVAGLALAGYLKRRRHP
jgi:hypothetical protein